MAVIFTRAGLGEVKTINHFGAVPYGELFLRQVETASADGGPRYITSLLPSFSSLGTVPELGTFAPS